MVETLPSDELPRPQPRIHRRKGQKGRNHSLVRIQPKDPDPRWLALDGQGHELTKHRLREYHATFGLVSSGVAGLLTACSNARADAAWVRTLAVEQGKPEWIRIAHQLEQVARGHELAAWEIGHREAEAWSKAQERTPADELAKALEADGRTVGEGGGGRGGT